jgi:hypothetical protein
MKNILAAFTLAVCVSTSLWCQPTITLVGSSPSLTKGDLNTEVITEIIQQKQVEVKQRVFRNTVVTHFNTTSYTEYLNNFLTYHYLYNVMDVITSGKNKTFITKSVTESSTDFAYVYGLALYTLSKQPQSRFNSLLLSTAKVSFTDTIGVDASKVHINQSSIEDMNVFLDLCYDVVLRDTTLGERFSFKDKLKDKEFLTWYNSDNTYLKELEEAKGDQTRLDQLKALYTSVQTKLKELQNITDNGTELYKNLKGFYTNLTKRDYQDFSLTRDQYDSFRFIINQFLDLAKNQTQSDVVALIIEFLQENSIVEFQNNSGDIVKKEDGSAVKGYLYVDIESLISSLAEKFKLNGKNSGKYVQLFFTVGTNYASFTNDANLLGINDVGGRNTLHNMYFASEKIGIRWKLWNWKYTHSFSAGENFKYYNRPGTTRCWLRPQQKPLVSDLHVLAYGSGILYNLAPLNSEEEFNYAIGGIGVGATFFNGLTLSCTYACPFTDNKFTPTNSFVNIGIDVPIVEYITALRNKNK